MKDQRNKRDPYFEASVDAVAEAIERGIAELDLSSLSVIEVAGAGSVPPWWDARTAPDLHGTG